MIAIIKKELKNYFFSPIGYIVIGIFLIAFSVFFYLTSIQSATIDLTALFYYSALYGLMFMAPLLTMWSIAGERKNGTDQLLMTSPVSMIGLVMAKFISAVLLIVIPVICSLMYFLILAHYQVPDYRTYLTSILGFLLLATTYISFGILASSLTESPIISAIMTFAIVFASTWVPYFVQNLSGLSLIDLFVNFLYGQIDIVALVFFVTLTMLCLTITVIIMQRRKSVK